MHFRADSRSSRLSVRSFVGLVILLWGLTASAQSPGTAPASNGHGGSKFELFCTDCDQSSLFYTTIGFEIVARTDYGYLTLRKGDTVVALSPVPWWLPLRWFWFLRYPPIGVEIVLYAGNLAELHARLEAAGFRPGEVRRQPWGDVDFRVSDHDGYYVRISEGQPVPEARS